MAYPGGKAGAGVYQKLINLMPPHRVYIEPFVGGGAIIKAKRPAQLNIGIDLDPDAVRAIASADLGGCGDARSRRLGEFVVTSASIEEFRRRRHSPVSAMVDRGSPGPTMKASRGRWPAPAISDPLARDGDAVPRFGFIVGDGIEFLEHYDFKGDELVYCDPPYLMETRRSARGLYKFELPELEHRRLLRVVMGLPCRVMLSGYYSKTYADALRGWYQVHFEAMTRGGRMATEWVWFNYPPPVELHDYRYLGENFRERERITRKTKRWTARLRKMPALEKQALLAAIAGIDKDGDASSLRKLRK